MPVKAAPVPIVSAYYWTGFYVGANGGYGWGRSNAETIFNDGVTGAVLAVVPNTLNPNGGFGGLQAGYNWQTGRIIVGVETDMQWSGLRGSMLFACTTACSVDGTVAATLDPKLQWFGTLRGRLGVTASRVMVYLTGGLAYGEVKTDGTFSGWAGDEVTNFGDL